MGEANAKNVAKGAGDFAPVVKDEYDAAAFEPAVQFRHLRPQVRLVLFYNIKIKRH